MIYTNVIITKKGAALITKMEVGGGSMEIKNIVLGAGTNKLTEESIQLSDPRQEFLFESVQRSKESPEKVIMQVSPNNEGLEEGYVIREIGVYAEDPDEGRILFAVINTNDESKDYDSFPAYRSKEDYKDIIFYFEMTVGNSENVTFELSPESIRKQVSENTIKLSKIEEGATKPLVFTNISVTESEFVSDITYEDYPFKEDIICSGITENYIPTVNFAMNQAMSGNFAPIAVSGENVITIYAVEKETESFIIPSIVCVKGSV